MGLSIGIDVGGTKIAAGVVDDTGTIGARAHRDTPADSADRIVEEICAAASELIASHDVEAVGIGAAGYVSADRGTVLFAPNLDRRRHRDRRRAAARRARCRGRDRAPAGGAGRAPLRLRRARLLGAVRVRLGAGP